jgi:hypothetical protein
VADAVNHIPLVGKYIVIMIPPNFEGEFFWEVIGEPISEF